IAAGLAVFAVQIGDGAGALALAPAGAITGIGIAVALPNLAAVAVGTVEPQDIGRASGMINTARQLGAGFGVAVGVAVAQAPGSLEAALVIAASSAALGALAPVADRVGAVASAALQRA